MDVPVHLRRADPLHRPLRPAQGGACIARLAKRAGPSRWHGHREADDAVVVLARRLVIRMRDRSVRLSAFDVFLVPAGVEHRPMPRGEVHVLPIEPRGAPSPGDPATDEHQRRL